MSTTTRPSAKALRHAKQAETSQQVADAYRVLVELIGSDPRLAVLRESEIDRMNEQANEYDNDADYQREQAMIAGFDPMRDL